MVPSNAMMSPGPIARDSDGGRLCTRDKEGCSSTEAGTCTNETAALFPRPPLSALSTLSLSRIPVSEVSGAALLREVESVSMLTPAVAIVDNLAADGADMDMDMDADVDWLAKSSGA